MHEVLSDTNVVSRSCKKKSQADFWRDILTICIQTERNVMQIMNQNLLRAITYTKIMHNYNSYRGFIMVRVGSENVVTVFEQNAIGRCVSH